jgi:hypothetical protein
MSSTLAIYATRILQVRLLIQQYLDEDPTLEQLARTAGDCSITSTASPTTDPPHKAEQ